MSTPHAPAHASAHAHDQHHDGPPPDGGHGHGSARGYVIGFILSAVLTAIPFWLVMTGALPFQATGLIIVALAAVQMVVHVIFFLHMNSKSEGGWVMLAVIFTLIIVVISLVGTLWVMYHLDTNMMPGPHDMEEMLRNLQ